MGLKKTKFGTDPQGLSERLQAANATYNAEQQAVLDIITDRRNSITEVRASLFREDQALQDVVNTIKT